MDRLVRTVLFLDIDGICHPANACGPMPDGGVYGEDLFRWIAPLIALLNEMPHVDVVVHSSWRHSYDAVPKLLADLPAALAARVVGVTPLNIYGRQESIEAYVRRHRVQQFVAIDDARYAFSDDMPSWLVLSGPDGLSNPQTVQRLREALERAPLASQPRGVTRRNS